MTAKKFDVAVVPTIRRRSRSPKTNCSPSRISCRIGARSSAARGSSRSRVSSSATTDTAYAPAVASIATGAVSTPTSQPPMPGPAMFASS